MPLVDYLIIVPQDEELRFLAQAWKLDTSRVRIGHITYYRHLHKCNNEEALIVVAAMGKMGQSWSGLVASESLRIWNPANIILTGIAGTLVGDELPIGHIIVPENVIGYEIGNVVPSGDGVEFKFKYLSDRSDLDLVASARDFQQDERAYEDWRTEAHRLSEGELEILRESATVPKAHIGDKALLASGNLVVKSKRFAQNLRSAVNQKVSAVEMEAKGLFSAVEITQQRRERPGVLIVRGISDEAGDDKEIVDNRSAGVFRRSAMRSATLFLKHLIEYRMTKPSGAEQPRVPRFKVGGPSRDVLEWISEMKLPELGDNTACIGHDPLFQCENGAPALTLKFELIGSKPRDDFQMFAKLRQDSDGWMRYIDHEIPTRARSVIWKIDRSNQAYVLRFAAVGDVPSIKYRISIEDEFGRKASWREPNPN